MIIHPNLKNVLIEKGTIWNNNFPTPRKNGGFTHISAARPSWVIGKVHETDSGFLLKPTNKLSSLPIEFWNHELFDIDEQDTDYSIDFMERWGIPYHPCRNSPQFASSSILESINETELHRKYFFPEPKYDEVDSNNIFWESWGSPALFYISKAEFSSSIRWLKFAVLNLVYGVNGSPEYKVAECVNRAASFRLIQVEPYSELSAVFVDRNATNLLSCSMLTAAICGQLIDTFADKAEWRTCACKGCGRIFKRKRSDNLNIKPHSDSKYCCTKCKNRQTKRNQRIAAQNRIRH